MEITNILVLRLYIDFKKSRAFTVIQNFWKTLLFYFSLDGTLFLFTSFEAVDPHVFVHGVHIKRGIQPPSSLTYTLRTKDFSFAPTLILKIFRTVMFAGTMLKAGRK